MGTNNSVSESVSWNSFNKYYTQNSPDPSQARQYSFHKPLSQTFCSSLHLGICSFAINRVTATSFTFILIWGFFCDIILSRWFLFLNIWYRPSPLPYVDLKAPILSNLGFKTAVSSNCLLYNESLNTVVCLQLHIRGCMACGTGNISLGDTSKTDFHHVSRAYVPIPWQMTYAETGPTNELQLHMTLQVFCVCISDGCILLCNWMITK